MNLQVTTAPRTAHLHASDFAAIIGVDPYKTAVDVYAEKAEGVLFEPQDEDVREAMKWGVIFEDPIAKEWALANKIDPNHLVKPPTYVHPKHPEIALTPDRLIVPRMADPEGIFEAKTCGPRIEHLWDDGIPRHTICQVSIYRSAIPVPKVDVAALRSGQKLVQFVYESDEQFEAMLLEAGLKFWRDHILPKRPPRLDGGDGSKALLKKWFPSGGGTVRAANLAEVPLLEHFRELKQQFDSIEERLEVQKNIVRQLIGNDKGLSWQGGKVMNGNCSGKVSWDYEQLVSRLRHRLKGEDLEFLEAELKAAKKIGAGYRRLTSKFVE